LAFLQSLINYLDCWTGAYRNDVALKTAIMGFINAALKYGPGQVRLPFHLVWSVTVNS